MTDDQSQKSAVPTNNQKLTTFYIVRHGETEANLADIINGHFDTPLTESGQQQARERAKHLTEVHFDAIFSSDLGRTQRTAGFLAQDRKLAIITTRLLRERFFGDFEGRTGQEYRSELRKEIEKFLTLTEQGKLNFRHHPSMETFGESAQRLILFLRETAVAYPEKCILVVSHGAIMRAFLMRLGYATYGELRGDAIKNTGYIKIETDGIDFFIRETYGIEKVTS